MRKLKKIKTVLKYFLLVLITLVFLFPVIYMIACSFMSQRQLTEMLDFANGEYKSVELIPQLFSLNQYYKVFFRRPEYLIKFWNSVIMTFPTVVCQVFVSALAAFAFAKLRFPFRDKLFFIYIILLILPVQVTLVPNYMVLDKMGLLNNFLAVIFPGTFSAFGVCMLRQSIRYISNASIEAALMDGASHLKIFTSVILPQTKGGIVTLTLLSFIDNWNVVEQPLVYFNDKAMYPLSVGLTDIAGCDGAVAFACGVMFMIPSLLIYFYGKNDIESSFM